MAAKILNLDALIPEQQYVQLHGTKHEVKTPTLNMYLKVMQSRGRIKSADSELNQMQMSIDLIKMACPTIDEQTLVNLPMQAINALGELIQSLMEDQVDEGEAGNESESGESTSLS